MKHHAVLVIVALCSLAACRKKALPNITGAFAGSATQSVFLPVERHASTMRTDLVVTLSDEQETSTAVRIRLKDEVSIAHVACEGRAARTDREDGASYVLPSLSCHFVDPNGLPRDRWPRCQIQAQALGLRYDRAANHITLDVGGLDVAFTATPPTDYEACSIWTRAQAPNATALRAQAPAAAVR